MAAWRLGCRRLWLIRVRAAICHMGIVGMSRGLLVMGWVFGYRFLWLA